MMQIDPQLSTIILWRPEVAFAGFSERTNPQAGTCGQWLNDQGKKSGAAVPQREFGPVFCAEFAQHVFDVNFYGAGLEPQLFGNLLVG